MSVRTALALAASLLLLAAPAIAEPKDGPATKLGKDAMEGDYLAMRFKQAEQKLKRALAMCGKKQCLAVVRARLHADLAIVYIAGLKKPDKGKKELKSALDADPAIQLNPDFSTPDAEKIFAETGGIKQEPESEDEDDSEAAEDEAAREAAADAAMPRNWVSLVFQQELLLHEARTGVCSPSNAAQYECFVGNATYSGTIYPGAGNALGTGVGLATRRILLGYEHLLLGKITVGGRIGFALGGRPNATLVISPGFNPLHAEVRGSYWFGQKPFQRKGARFFAGLAAGVGEVNGSARVNLAFMPGQSRPVDAWRKTGAPFLGLHGGVAYAFVQSHAFVIELRALRSFGPSAFAGAASLGYSLGF